MPLNKHNSVFSSPIYYRIDDNINIRIQCITINLLLYILNMGDKMKNLLILTLFLLTASCASTKETQKDVIANDGVATVILQKTGEFSDIKAGNLSTQPNFEQSVANKLAEELDDKFKGTGLTVEVTFTNIDLAGETRFNSQEIRILQDIYIPQMSFEFVLKSSEGKVVHKDTADLKGMGYLTKGVSLRESHNFIGYDTRMLTDYFDKVLKKIKI